MYRETDNELIDVVTLRAQKQRSAGTIYISKDMFDRIELPRDTPLKITYLKKENKIIIEQI
jgi:hypothetical protein